MIGLHTPGPWTVGSPTGHNASNVYAGKDAICSMLGMSLHRAIDELSERDAEGLANARLIASAPALQAHADAMAVALRRIEQRTRALPDDTAADNKRDKFHAHSIAQSALAAYQATKP